MAVGLSLFMIVLISVVMGASLPVAMYIVGWDPAQAGPTIQVVMDIVGVLVTLSVCSSLLE